MTDIPEVIGTPAEDVPTPVTPEPEPEHHEPERHENSRPEFVDEILSRIDGIRDALTSGAPPALDPVVTPDESPVKRPWTHRGFGKGK